MNLKKQLSPTIALFGLMMLNVTGNNGNKESPPVHPIPEASLRGITNGLEIQKQKSIQNDSEGRGIKPMMIKENAPLKKYSFKFDSSEMKIIGDMDKVKCENGCLELDAAEKAVGVSWEIPWDGKNNLFSLSVELKTDLDPATKLHVGAAYYSALGEFLGEEMKGMGMWLPSRKVDRYG